MVNHACIGLLLALLFSSLPPLDAWCSTTGYKYDATKTTLSSGSPIGRLACNVCAAGYGAQLYSTLSGWHYGNCSEPQRADTRLYCAACQAGSYSTGGWCPCRACRAAGGPCNQPPTCKAFRSCDTTGRCTWCNAADNTPCTNSAGAAGTCKYGSCQVAPNVNACLTYTCKSTGPGGASTCTDLPNPAPNSAAGRVCGCQLSTSTYKDDATGCVDIDACKPSNWPCKQDGKGGAADCLDILKAPNSTAGRKCTCKVATSVYANETVGCVDIDACQWWRCQQGGTGGLALCSDLDKAANSTAGRTCSCQLSTSIYANDTAGCVDINACRWWRCKQDGPGGGADCMDLLQAPNSTVGRTCSCKLQFSAYQNETAGCVDIDACIGWPCNRGGPGGSALCTDKAAAANSTEGRTCSCDNGATYADATGCPSLGTLTLSRDRIPVGSSGDLVTFTAKFASSTTGKVVELHNADPQGAPTSLMSTMVDDGSYAAGDAAANDGLFTYTMTTAAADCASAGDRYFVALIKDEEPPKRELLTATLHCFTPATTEQVSQSMRHASEVYNQLQQMVTSQGWTVPAALASMATTLRTNAAVDDASVQTTGAAVTWRSLEGLKFRAYLPLPGQRARPVNVSYTAGAALVKGVQPTVLRPRSEGARASELPVSGLLPARGGSRGVNTTKTHLPRPLGVPDLEATTTVKAASASDTCSISKGKVLLVSPYTNEFTAQGGDESLTIATNFAAAGYTVEYFCQPPAGSPGTCKDVKDFLRLETFRDWGRYAAVVLVTHGDASDDGSDAVVDTGVKYDSLTGGDSELVTKAWMQDDLEVLAGPAGGVIGLKPGWFKQADLLPLCGTVVYFGACRSARSTTAGSFARVFTDQSAASFVGYTDYVASSFSTARGLSTFTHLLADGTVGTYPANGDVETDSNPAKFVGYHLDANRRLPAMCNSLAATDLLIKYSWPPALQNIALRTATTFNGIQPVTTGLECAVYTNSIEWSNSDAFSTGKETVKILLSQARSDGAFTDRVKIALRAGWTAPNTPDTAAVATVWLVDKATGTRVGGQAMAIHPKQWPATGCADASAVGYVVVEVQGSAGSEKVTFSLTYSDPDASSPPPNGQCPALLAVGLNHACVALGDGSMKCWGDNTDGQIGDGAVVTGLQKPAAAPVTVANLQDVSIYHRSLALGGPYTCALLTNRTVACWGANADGVLGQGDAGVSYSSVPLLVKGLSDVDSIAAGWRHACALLRDHKVKCWGSNQYYALGLGEVVGNPPNPQVTFSATPQAVVGLSDVQAVSLGVGHGCALLMSGQVYCWGRAGQGQLGNGNPGYAASVPVKAALSKPALEVACGARHTCARLEDNTVACWGDNTYGACGQPSTAPPNNKVLTPTAVAGLHNVLQIGLGYEHSCAVLTDQTARCWGKNDYGQLGAPDASVQSTTPVIVALQGIAAVSGGGGHTCALLTNSSVACWGENDYGQTGIGSVSGSVLTPTSVKHLTCTRDQLECRTITKPGGVYFYAMPCSDSTAYVKGTLNPGQTVQYDLIKGHQASSCPAFDKHCWVYAYVEGVGAWVPSGLPQQPQELPCGVAPGNAYIGCCEGLPCTQHISGCTAELRADTDFRGGDLAVPGNGNAVPELGDCCRICTANQDCQAFTYHSQSKACWIKGNSVAAQLFYPGAVSGVVRSLTEPSVVGAVCSTVLNDFAAAGTIDATGSDACFPDVCASAVPVPSPTTSIYNAPNINETFYRVFNGTPTAMRRRLASDSGTASAQVAKCFAKACRLVTRTNIGPSTTQMLLRAARVNAQLKLEAVDPCNPVLPGDKEQDLSKIQECEEVMYVGTVIECKQLDDPKWPVAWARVVVMDHTRLFYDLDNLYRYGAFWLPIRGGIDTSNPQNNFAWHITPSCDDPYCADRRSQTGVLAMQSRLLECPCDTSKELAVVPQCAEVTHRALPGTYAMKGSCPSADTQWPTTFEDASYFRYLPVQYGQTLGYLQHRRRDLSAAFLLSGCPALTAEMLDADKYLEAQLWNPPDIHSQWITDAKLDRKTVLNRLKQLARNPNILGQGGVGTCGPVAFYHLWLKRDPLAAVQFAATLLDTGKAYIGSLEIRPNGGSLTETDYPQLEADHANFLPPAADWMVAGSMRDSENAFWDFTGIPGDEGPTGVGGITTDLELENWLTSTGIYSQVTTNTHKTLEDAQKLQPSDTVDVLLVINADMLKAALGNGIPGTGGLTTTADHYVVLLTPITYEKERVSFSVWTWSREMQLDLSKEQFEGNYFGEMIATIT